MNRMTTILVSLGVLAALACGGVALWNAQIASAQERLRAEVQEAANRIVGEADVRTFVVLYLQCEAEEEIRQETVELERTEDLDGHFIYRAVPEGCRLKEANFLTRLNGHIPQQVDIRVPGMEVEGTVRLDNHSPDTRVYVDAVGKIRWFGRTVTASASAPLWTDAYTEALQRRLVEAVTQATPLLIERETGVVATEVTVEEQEPTAEDESAQEHPHNADRTPNGSGPGSDDEVIYVNGKPFDFSVPPQIPEGMSPTPDDTWWNEEFLSNFFTGPSEWDGDWDEWYKKATTPPVQQP